MVGRYVPINPHLPPDPKRDQWYDTRWGDPPNRNTSPELLPQRRALRPPLEGQPHRLDLPLLLRRPGPEHPQRRRPPGRLPRAPPPDAPPPVQAGRHVLRPGQLRPRLRPRPARQRPDRLALPVLPPDHRGRRLNRRPTRRPRPDARPTVTVTRPAGNHPAGLVASSQARLASSNPPTPGHIELLRDRQREARGRPSGPSRSRPARIAGRPRPSAPPRASPGGPPR